MARESLRNLIERSRSVQIPNHVAFFAWFLIAYVTAASTVLLVEDLYEMIVSRTILVYIAVIVFSTVIFIISRILGRTDVIDASWGPAFVVAALTSFSLNPYGVEVGWNMQTITTLLVIIWAGRLSYHIGSRLVRTPEDPRYVDMRKKWRGNEMINTYLRVFLVQALLAATISIAIIHINFSVPKPVNYFVLAGSAIWLIGFMFEVIGDWQLKRFLADKKNRGKLMTSGLWKYTRHPNYFGEALLWFGVAFIAWGTAYGWVALITPVLITYLLLYVSGVPLAEESHKRKTGWAEYKKRTSKFIPMLPRS